MKKVALDEPTYTLTLGTVDRWPDYKGSSDFVIHTVRVKIKAELEGVAPVENERTVSLMADGDPVPEEFIGWEDLATDEGREKVLGWAVVELEKLNTPDPDSEFFDNATQEGLTMISTLESQKRQFCNQLTYNRDTEVLSEGMSGVVRTSQTEEL